MFAWQVDQQTPPLPEMTQIETNREEKAELGHETGSSDSPQFSPQVEEINQMDLQVDPQIIPQMDEFPPPPLQEEINDRIKQLAIKHNVNHRKLMLKIDICVVPLTCLLYVLAFLDRVNVSNANVYGMSEDLNMTGNKFNTALAIFFVPYVIAEIPSNWLMKKFKPHVWLTGCMTLFGVCLLGQGFVRTYGQLLATRFLLGLFEAGMFPGCFYLLSMWYRREEAQKRYSFFFSSTTLAGAFGGLIAAGIHNLDHDRGIRSWQWIFIIEGACTATIGILMIFCLADFPEEARFLKQNERDFIKEKLEIGNAGVSEYERSMTRKDLAFVFSDWKVWISGLLYFGYIVPAYGYAYFGTAIVKGLGYSPVMTQLYSVPPWVAGFGFSMVSAAFSDHFRHRFAFAFFAGIVAVAGFGLLMGQTEHIGIRYGSLFMICAGTYTAMPILVCWTQMNFSGHHRKAIASGWQIGFGNTAGFISTFIFEANEAPTYPTALDVCLAFTAFSTVLLAVYFAAIWADNRYKRTEKYRQKFRSWPKEKQQLAGELHPSIFYSY